MLSERALFRLLVAVLIAGTVIGVTLALVVPAHGKTTVEAMRLVVPRYTPAVPVQRIGLNCPVAYRGRERARVCAAKHVSRDRLGNQTVRAAGAVAVYRQLRHGRTGRWVRVERRLALRVRLVGDRVVSRAFPYHTTRRAKVGPWRVADSGTDARVLAFLEWGDGRWTEHLVYSD